MKRYMSDEWSYALVREMQYSHYAILAFGDSR